MPERVTYGQLREVLIALGFKETRRAEGIGLAHPESDTLFLFRAYKDSDKVQPAELFQVRELLDARALLEADSFNRLSRLTNRYETAEEQILQILCFLALRKNTWPPGPVAQCH